MRTLRYGDKGEEVKQLQTILKQQGFFKGEIGGNFLQITRNAVIYFQQTHLGPDGEPLEVDGVVGKDTWWALENPSGTPQRSWLEGTMPKGLTPLRQRQLEVALNEHALKVCEEPDGSNWGDGVVKYRGMQGQHWCCYFWSWCNRECFGKYSLGAKVGLCSSAWKKANELGMARDKGTYVPIPGDAFIMLYRDAKNKLTGSGHIGFVLAVELANGKAVKINTVEGNCGNRVKVGLRNLSDPNVVGFINNFPSDEQPTAWEKGLTMSKTSTGDSTR